MATSPSTPAPMERFRLTSSDGLCIACARWESRSPARAVVQIAHGMGEHMGRYADTIDVLVAAGLTVYAVEVEASSLPQSGIDPPEDAERATASLKTHGDPYLGDPYNT